LLERLEGEGIGAVSRPGALEFPVGMAPGAQREPDPVLDGFQVERLANPGLARSRAANGVNAGGALALLVGGDRRFPVLEFYVPPPKQSRCVRIA